MQSTSCQEISENIWCWKLQLAKNPTGWGSFEPQVSPRRLENHYLLSFHPLKAPAVPEVSLAVAVDLFSAVMVTWVCALC